MFIKKLIYHFKYMISNNRGAVSFDGIDDKCQVIGAPISNYPCTIYCRFKANNNSAGYLFSLANSTSDANYLHLIHTSTGYVWSMRYTTNSGPNTTGWLHQTNLGTTDTLWHTIILRSNAINSHEFYLDGVLLSSSALSVTFLSGLNTAQVAHWLRSSSLGYGNVTIDEFAIWNTNISNGDIATLNGTGVRAANSILPSNLKLSWILDQTALGLSANGDIVIDESNNTFNGTVDNGANNTGTLSVGGPYVPNLIQDINEDIVVSDDVQFAKNIDHNITDDITVTDEIVLLPTITTEQTEDITVDDTIILDVAVDHSTDIKVSDEISVNVDLEKAIGVEDITISDAIDVYATTGPASFASKIISFNPLIIIADTAPLKIVRVDVTNPTNPTWQKYKINGVANPKDVAYDSVLGLIFIVCADGKILQVDSTDFDIKTIFDTGDLNHLLNIAIFEGYYRVYAGTDDPNGELITLDNRYTAKMGIDIQCLQTIANNISLKIDTVNARSLGTNIQILGVKSNTVGIDIRIIPQPNLPTIITDPTILFDELAQNPIKQTDCYIYVDGVEFSDVELDSVQIYHTIGEKSTAGFKLRRRHDNYNKTIDGTPAVIDQQNAISIVIKGNIVFSGNITTINSFSENESVEVICSADEAPNERRTVVIPLSGLNKKLNLYDCMVNDPTNYNPIIDPNDEDPEFYKGIRVNLGTKITPNVQIDSDIGESIPIGKFSGEYLADIIKTGNFQPEQNWTYFWKISADNWYTGEEINTLNYVGTSMAQLSTDIWNITGVSLERQRKFKNLETELGYYQVGEAPFKEINVSNGWLRRMRSYQDEKADLIEIYNASYDYRSYARLIAELKYEKLQNINGDILPRANATIEILLDAYFYYGIKLLTRINVDNTMQPGIFTNNHGFPVAVKSISISLNSMQITLNCDNSKSQVEFDEIDAQSPDPNSDEYTLDKSTMSIAPKFDFNKNSNLTSDWKATNV